jgi:hypothetical protein
VRLVKSKNQNLWLVWHLMSKCKISKKPDSCWIWKGGKYSSGYGYFTYLGDKYMIHRLMYELWYGEIPKGLIIRHMCNNPECCFPEHLKIGTQKENMADMRRAGRQGYVIKLTPAQKTQIRKSPLSQRALAEIYRVSATTIWRVRNNHK